MRKLVETKHGSMLINTNDIYIGHSLDLYGEWAWQEIELVMPYAHSTVIDVGANIGTHTLSFAKRAKQVISFEPVIPIFTQLCTNVSLNGLYNTSLFNCALSNEIGETHVPIFDYFQKNNYGSAHIGLPSGQKAHTMTLDSFQFDDVSLIKIDVEGHELEVLEGARDTIKRCKPVLYVESDRVSKVEDLCYCLELYSYRMVEYVIPLFRENNFRERIENVFQDIYSFNILCLPR